MTTVYVPVGAERYELCAPVQEADYETLHVQIDGTPRSGTWAPVAVEIVQKDGKKKLAPSDSPWLGAHALIFRPSAADALKDLLTQNGELLALDSGDARLMVFNPTQVVDALDTDNASILRFGNGDIMQISHYAFRPALVAKLDVFKIPDLRVSPTFVSQRVVDRWGEAGLEGLDFEAVWSA